MTGASKVSTISIIIIIYMRKWETFHKKSRQKAFKDNVWKKDLSGNDTHVMIIRILLMKLALVFIIEHLMTEPDDMDNELH